MKDKNFSDTKNTSFDDDRSKMFVSSIESFSSDDIKIVYQNDKRKSIFPLILRALMMALSFGVFCFSVFTITKRISEDRIQEDIYNEIRHNTNIASAVVKPEQLFEPNNMYTVLEMLEADGNYNDYKSEVTPDDIKDFRQDMLEVAAINPDTYGWIYFRGTQKFTKNGINYPIMSGDNDYYLHHDYLGNDPYAGSIFAEQTLNKIHTANINVLLYGHCMTNGSMFRPIKLWYDSANKNKLAEEMQIEIYTADGAYIYELLSAYRSDDSNFMKVVYKDEADYLAFLKDIMRRSTLKKKVLYTANSKICTLVTCTNVKSNPKERYVVHGILKQFVPYE